MVQQQIVYGLIFIKSEFLSNLNLWHIWVHKWILLTTLCWSNYWKNGESERKTMLFLKWHRSWLGLVSTSIILLICQHLFLVTAWLSVLSWRYRKRDKFDNLVERPCLALFSMCHTNHLRFHQIDFLEENCRRKVKCQLCPNSCLSCNDCLGRIIPE